MDMFLPEAFAKKLMKYHRQFANSTLAAANDASVMLAIRGVNCAAML